MNVFLTNVIIVLCSIRVKTSGITEHVGCALTCSDYPVKADNLASQVAAGASHC